MTPPTFTKKAMIFEKPFENLYLLKEEGSREIEDYEHEFKNIQKILIED